MQYFLPTFRRSSWISLGSLQNCGFLHILQGQVSEYSGDLWRALKHQGALLQEVLQGAADYSRKRTRGRQWYLISICVDLQDMFQYYVIDVYNHGETKIFPKHIFGIVTVLYLNLREIN